MDKQLIFNLTQTTRDETLQELVELISVAGKLQDKDKFFQAITEREKIVSTGIGMGIAIPHAKLRSYDEFFIAIGRLKSPVEWNALDGAPVKLIFMIGGPDDKQTEYLQLLSHLTYAIKDEERRQKLLTLTDPIAIIELFKAI
jgi:PTS system nitrogen regulatory IIA component